ncbi:MAG TPA: ester cyclase [Anaerolineae bacterium]|jgi:steroid delta-isomerase-like uncharacterized protein|nr:ester cyclase [Anaerolineae bacterium]
MSIEENKELVRSFIEAVPKDLDDVDRIIDQFVAPDAVEHNPETGQTLDLEGAKQYAKGVYRAFPDLKEVVKDMVAEGDKVATRSVATGTHKGEFSGIPPTGKTFSVDYFEIYRVVDGKIVEHWWVLDRYKMLVQLGVISEAEAA